MKDHVHLHVGYVPKLSVSDLVRQLKGRSAKILLEEYSELRSRYDGPNSDQNFILEQFQ